MVLLHISILLKYIFCVKKELWFILYFILMKMMKKICYCFSVLVLLQWKINSDHLGVLICEMQNLLYLLSKTNFTLIIISIYIIVFFYIFKYIHTYFYAGIITEWMASIHPIEECNQVMLKVYLYLYDWFLLLPILPFMADPKAHFAIC